MTTCKHLKNSITVLLILFLFQSCAEKATTATTNDFIKKVETGLIPSVYIEGDAAWSIEERMKHYKIPGVSIAVIHKGKIVWTKGYGVTDSISKSPVTAQTLFHASLLSMPLTAYGALRLVEQQKVALNTNVNNYLTSWKVPENEFTKDHKVTLKNLLNHSAGIALHGIPGHPTDEFIPTLVQVLNGTAPAKNVPVILNKEPEESIYISAAGYAIAQQLMIDITGKKFPELMHELVFQPLGMTNSTFNQTLSTAQLNRAATGYLTDGSMVKGKGHNYPVMAANGIWSTAEDLAKFVLNIQQTLKGTSTKGLSKEMTELMLTPYGTSSYGPGFKYGLGMQLIDKQGETYLRHWGWNRGFFGQIAAHRDKGFAVVVLTNSTYPAFNEEVIRSVARVYDWDHYVHIYQKKNVQLFLDGNFEKALEIYKNSLKQDPNNPIISRVNINRLGYHFIRKEQTNAAHDVFKVNTMLYPENADVYDSYGEVCKLQGNIDLAILNYSKSLELDPQNNNAKEMLTELQKSN